MADPLPQDPLLTGGLVAGTLLDVDVVTAFPVFAAVVEDVVAAAAVVEDVVAAFPVFAAVVDVVVVAALAVVEVAGLSPPSAAAHWPACLKVPAWQQYVADE